MLGKCANVRMCKCANAWLMCKCENVQMCKCLGNVWKCENVRII
jgi:hypothetical protein